MKKIFLPILFLLISNFAFSQCATLGASSATLISGAGLGTTDSSYSKNSIVQYCVTVTSYFQANGNYIHSIIPSGFPAGSVVSIGSDPSSANGQWLFVSSSANPKFLGPGYYFDDDWDGNPFNGFGDAGINTGANATFCFKVKMPSTGSLTSFVPKIDINGDGTTGAWLNGSCNDAIIPMPGLAIQAALQITLLNFNANYVDKNLVNVNWETTNEKDFSYYIVQKSINNNEFEDLTTIQAKGNNQEQTVNKYNTTDYLTDGSIANYRLKLVDINGAINYSKIINLKSNLIDVATVYPNKVESNLNIDININTQSKIEIIIVDITGKAIVKETSICDKGFQTLKVDTQNFANGIYTVLVNKNDKLLKVDRIVK